MPYIRDAREATHEGSLVPRVRRTRGPYLRRRSRSGTRAGRGAGPGTGHGREPRGPGYARRGVPVPHHLPLHAGAGVLGGSGRDSRGRRPCQGGGPGMGVQPDSLRVLRLLHDGSRQLVRSGRRQGTPSPGRLCPARMPAGLRAPAPAGPRLLRGLGGGAHRLRHSLARVDEPRQAPRR